MSELNVKTTGRFVRVKGRADPGEVVGTINFGTTGMIRCFEVYFEADGLCATYAINKVHFVEPA
ncbi:hypothetical protein Achl_4137 (plasmid) [Pseudarthrobacter chlorophenolicus A6]|uniref:Uncharacterized protein n=1 Tax=Pseudarthrobacter chlorophenolicus (strain ATCC 700700 / DSM 12829 / CIP 107037 / JCM 12360 / KCTC 9906 / NCIMB 13794 / A6) TaxID=452863 RepID=B8HI41_PSECP|nr:hypothetical protein [Pseudarthrobacter chlorophenolicus]ACL42088.1 hypothetical protein Achl_4137 [Pseudarthrobacter chlorophenolicus A6]SDQ13265.1 hypothetical protein SAMN04489738_0196 [Pseudarthrobacter chlorophenolicus]